VIVSSALCETVSGEPLDGRELFDRVGGPVNDHVMRGGAQVVDDLTDPHLLGVTEAGNDALRVLSPCGDADRTPVQCVALTARNEGARIHGAVWRGTAVAGWDARVASSTRVDAPVARRGGSVVAASRNSQGEGEGGGEEGGEGKRGGAHGHLLNIAGGLMRADSTRFDQTRIVSP
jgi:hypothetical protein